MRKIQFLGAAGTVTGSSYMLTDETGKGILIDLGMFQGNKDIESYNDETIPLHPSDILGVFLTHAHLDHCGRIPLLRKLGYTGSIYMTPATKSIMELTLLDAVHVARQREYGRLLYDERDVQWTLAHTKTLDYHKPVSISDYTITLRDAGHILGSALLHISYHHIKDGIQTIVFSGDLGNYPEELVQHTEFIQNADIIVMESTYGDRTHANENPYDVITEEIQTIEETKGTLLIPAFSVERSQEILHVIDHLKKDGKVKEETRVFLDSVLAIHVTNVYQRYKHLYNHELAEHAHMDDPFTFPGLSMVESHNESCKLDNLPGPKVIIAGSGMMTGGRILRHAKTYLPIPTTRLLLVGFQAEGTIGRMLLDGQKNIPIEGKTIPVRATIRKSSGLSSHADQPKLLQWLSHVEHPSAICLTHGEDPQRSVLRNAIETRWPHVAVYTPQKGETLTFSKHPIVYYASAKHQSNRHSRNAQTAPPAIIQRAGHEKNL